MMVEDITGSETPGAYEDPSGGKKGFAAFASTKQGRLILGAVGGTILLAIVAAVLFMFVLQPDAETPEEALIPPAGSVPAGAGTVEQVSSEAEPTVPQTKPLSSTFVFRDIFVPTTKPSVKPASANTSGTTNDTDGSSGTDSDTGGSSGDDDGSSDAAVPSDTLLLKSVSTVDGEPVATFVWNGQTYEAGEGEQLGDTPWKVVDISGNTVVMLYGDTRVSLTVGQGITK